MPFHRLSTFLLGISLATAAGCAARTETYGGGASGGEPPTLGAREVPMFDHYCAVLGGGRGGEAEFTRLLDKASDEGWEMVGVGVSEGLLVCFKRPRGERAAPPQTPPAETPPAPQPPPA
jgi:hypothetical protein